MRAEIFEYGEPDGRMQKMDVADAGNLESWLVPRGDVESTFAAARDAFARISLLGAFAEGAPGAIAPRAVAGTTEVALCFRGLEFARWSRDGISFGLGDTRERLTGSTEPRLERLIRQLDLHRNPLAKQMNHRLYRAAPDSLKRCAQACGSYCWALNMGMKSLYPNFVSGP